MVINKVIENKKEMIFPTSIKNANTTTDDKKEITNAFNHFFVNVGPKLANQLPTVGNIEFPTSNSNTMFLNGVCQSDVLEAVYQFKSKKSTDCHGIDMSLIKDVIHCIVEPLTYICNKSFSTGIVPDQMKMAKVIPIYKGGNKQLLSNDRPISLLPQFSKI